MVAMFFMCEGKVGNLIYYFLVILFFGKIAAGLLKSICFINYFICNGKVSDFSCIKIYGYIYMVITHGYVNLTQKLN